MSEHKPVLPEDVTDLAGLPRRFDLFVAEMRTFTELMFDRVGKGFSDVLDRMADIAAEQAVQRRDRDDDRKRLDDHERRLAALEAPHDAEIRVHRLLKPRKKR